MKFLDRCFIQEGHKSWFSFIDSSAKNYKINLPNCSINEIPKMIADFYKKSVEDQLEIFSEDEHFILFCKKHDSIRKNFIF